MWERESVLQLVLALIDLRGQLEQQQQLRCSLVSAVVQ